MLSSFRRSKRNTAEPQHALAANSEILDEPDVEHEIERDAEPDLSEHQQLAVEPDDPLDALVARMLHNAKVHEFYIHRSWFRERPELWVVYWHYDAKIRGDAGDVAHETLSQALLRAVASVYSASGNERLFIPRRDVLESSYRYSQIVAMHEATNNIHIRWLGSSWYVRWESKDHSRTVDREGEVKRTDFGEAVAAAFDRVCAYRIVRQAAIPERGASERAIQGPAFEEAS